MMNILKKSCLLFIITIFMFFVLKILKGDLPTMLCYTIMLLELVIILCSSLYILLTKTQKKMSNSKTNSSL